MDQQNAMILIRRQRRSIHGGAIAYMAFLGFQAPLIAAGISRDIRTRLLGLNRDGYYAWVQYVREAIAMVLMAREREQISLTGNHASR